jgi:hypothetical protein
MKSNRSLAHSVLPVLLLCSGALGVSVACSDSNPVTPPTGTDAGADSAPPAQTGEIQVTASGEGLGLEGFDFPPSAKQEAYFIDGWEVKFDHYYVSVAGITISEEPDKNPGDQSVTGAAVASLPGAFLVDLHKTGPLPGKGEDDKAWPLGVIKNQNLAGGKAFDKASKYAFSFEMAPASASATKVGLAASDDAGINEMVQKGYTVFMIGKATFKGTTCTPAMDNGLPREVVFRFGFKNAKKFINCQNPDLGEQGGESPRGLAIKENEATVAQVTMHADHPFWDAIEEDAPLRFNQFAYVAKEKSKGTAAAPLTLEDLVGVPFNPVKIGANALQDRTCMPAPAPGAAGDLSLDPKGVAVADLAAFASELQSSQGHLNADGLCAVK